MQFHIVYMPGTVRYLTPLVRSLLEWSDCTFRLVANGCAPGEQHELERFCEKDARLVFISLPFSAPVAHGEALTYLQAENRADFFCFMDSDVFASGPFLPPFAKGSGRYSGQFSCAPLWCSPQETILPADYPRMYGRFHQTSDGLCLGSTYFAIYDNHALSEVIAGDKIEFSSYLWSGIPGLHQSWLQRQGLVKAYYDTGKLINLRLLARGYELRFREVPALHHLGGFSRFAVESSTLWSQRSGAAWRMLLKGNWRRLILAIPYWMRVEKYLPGRLLADSILIRQVSAERYFSELIMSAVDGTPPPVARPVGDKQMSKIFERAANSLMAIYG
jgi:hypothetical protein